MSAIKTAPATAPASVTTPQDRERQLGMTRAEIAPATLGIDQVRTGMRDDYKAYLHDRRGLMAKYNAALYGGGTKAGAIAVANQIRTLDAGYRSMASPLFAGEMEPQYANAYGTYLQTRKPLLAAVVTAKQSLALYKGDGIGTGKKAELEDTFAKAKAALMAFDEKYNGGHVAWGTAKDPWSPKAALLPPK